MEGMPGMSSPSANHSMHNHTTSSMSMSYSHMTFFWGKNSEILFSGFPGNRSGMYALALIFVFILTILLEWLSCRRWRANRRESHHRNQDGGMEGVAEEDVVVVGLLWTLLHTIRMGLAYIVMLAVMSFNVGVLIMVLAGHAVGFIVFSSGICLKQDNQIVGMAETCDPHH